MLKAQLGLGLSGLVLITIVSSPAAAFKKVDLPGTRTKGYMQDLCNQVQGQYVEGQGQYGCVTNCGDQSKENDACGINCSEDTNKCYGWTPGRSVPHSPVRILHPPSGATKSRAR